MSRILVAPQELKGSLTAGEATRALEVGLRRGRPEWRLDLLPLADGGPGTLDLVQSQRPAARVRVEMVADPLGRPVQARWLQLDATTALVEMAEAAGLWRLGAERHPLDTDTRGVGQLIAAARAAGCTYIIVGAGGSATSDAGAGAATALGVRFLDARGEVLEPRPRELERCSRVETVGRVVPRLEVWTDVRNPLKDAALIYAPQKGATADEVALIGRAHAALERLAPRDAGLAPGAGAAGGLAFGLHAFLEATIEPGFHSLSTLLELEARVATASVVITAEGRLDNQTTWDKGPWAIARLARRHGVACVAFVGACTLPRSEWISRFDEVIELGPKDHPAPFERLAEAAARWAARGSRPQLG